MPRRNFSTADFSRTKKRTSDKLIFISCEGVETEEVYFDILASLFHNIRSKIKIVSVRGDYLLLDQKHKKKSKTEYVISQICFSENADISGGKPRILSAA